MINDIHQKRKNINYDQRLYRLFQLVKKMSNNLLKMLKNSQKLNMLMKMIITNLNLYRNNINKKRLNQQTTHLKKRRMKELKLIIKSED
jgi:hypothetical protein